MQGSSALFQSARAVLFRAASLGGAVFTQAICARGLGPTTYGSYGVIVANLQIATQVADLGGEGVTTRLLGKGGPSSAQIMRPLVSLRLAVGTILLVCTVLALIVLRPAEGLSGAVLIGALSLPLGSLASARASLVATHRFDRAQAALLLNAALALAIISAAMATGQLSLLVAVSAMTAGTALSGVLMATWTGWAGWRAAIDPGGARSLLRMSAPLAGSLIVGAAATRIPITIVVSVLGAAGAGLFYGAYKLFDLAHALPQNVLPTVFPWLVHLDPATESGRDGYRRLATGLVVAGGWLAAAFASGAPGVVRVLYGPRFDAAVPVLATVGWAMPMLLLSYAQGNLLIAQGRYSDQFRVTTVSALAAVALYPTLSFAAGLGGAAWAAVACEFATASVGAALVWGRCRLVPARGSAVLALAPPLVLTAAFQEWPIHSTASGIAVAAACGCVSLILLARVLSALPSPTGQDTAFLQPVETQ